MDFEEYRKQFPATRCFQRYSGEQRANHAASHRLTANRRNAVGEHYFVHAHVAGRAFPTRAQAERAGYERHQAAEPEMPLIHLTYTGPMAGTTLCGAPRGEGRAHHAVYAPVQNAQYRAQCCKSCLLKFAQAWSGTRSKPDWVVAITRDETCDAPADQLSLFPTNGDSHAN